jgi:hypothetical protein
MTRRLPYLAGAAAADDPVAAAADDTDDDDNDDVPLAENGLNASALSASYGLETDTRPRISQQTVAPGVPCSMMTSPGL